MIAMKICAACGASFPENEDNFYRRPDGKNGLCTSCIPCIKAQRKARWCREAEASNLRRRQKHNADRARNGTPGFMYTIVSDPDPIGGFRRGATIPSMQFNIGLGMGCFANGLVVRIRTKLYCVYGRRLIETKEN